ncbi:putative Bile salt-activated lipase [Glarea lozoyensis 74030]|uniref:Putative Bile salt-activated lipase n=1 Tax=Glarea lozoyensis (strain ATCC 74030 / MF5533) TaxID=1104152 RepID=H0EZ82_GLAL7|nr:putative Bile salt-activated lipase [Glarea lozoyensis 74030]
MKSVAAMLKPLVVALVAGVSLAVPSPDLLDSDVTILSDNDLQGPGGPCTPYSNATSADVGQDWQIQVESNNETVTGFRDRLTFRFRGIRFAPQPKRFTYPTLYSGSGEVVPALKYGPQCIQVSGGSEDCLFLNIWTPSLPSPSNTYKSKKLKPVLFWIYGGGFTENSAADPNFDGGNMASRGDVVMVAPNYRVGAFGFLALKDGTTNGNFGIADQILALNWVRKHIQDFGGDPEHITISK